MRHRDEGDTVPVENLDQDKEITEMRHLIADISANGEPTGTLARESARIVDAGIALESEVLSTIDPEFLRDEEISLAFPDGATCRFRYIEESPAVLATGMASNGMSALVKISGDLVLMDVTEPGSNGPYISGPLTVAVAPTDVASLHDMVVTAEEGYEAGFRGQNSCNR